jgi:hypothetical protein
VRAVTAALVAVALVPASAAKLPPAGLVVPGKSLGGIVLGMTPGQVERVWGGSHGRCRSCKQPTWYFNYAAFRPQGAGVEFRKGRVSAVFTLWAPAAWHTPKRLTIGDPAGRVTELYGALPQSHCLRYDADLILGPATTSIYVRDEKVWGFGLSRAGAPVCR